jgi:hypothetical protein
MSHADPMRKYRPHPATLVALVALVFAAAPAADAAIQTVKRAAFAKRAGTADKAKNAAKVGGFKPSKAALPNHIPVLDGGGKLPGAALPAAKHNVTSEFNSANSGPTVTTLASGAPEQTFNDFGESPIKVDGDGLLYVTGQVEVFGKPRGTAVCHVEVAPTPGPSDTNPSGPFERFGQDSYATSGDATMPQSLPLAAEKVVKAGYYILRTRCSATTGTAEVKNSDLNAIGIPNQP